MEFCPSPAQLTLPIDEVHIWRAELQTLHSLIPTLLPLLSEDEQARANRFYFRKDHDRFILARGILRVLLGRYLDLPPQQLQFQYNPTGKPLLNSQTQLCFNLSHSHQLALYAVAWNRDVGIDVEQISLERDYESIAARFFAPQEQATLNQLSPDLKLQGFFNGWTRKEALLKAIGKGLTLPLDQFAVSLSPGEPARLLQSAWNLPQSLDEWTLQDLQVGEGYAAAVAAVGEDWQLRGWQVDAEVLMAIG